MQLKYIPFALLSAFGVKYLITGIDNTGVACLAALGVISFCLEKFIENKSLAELKKQHESIQLELKKQAEDLEQSKAFISSIRLNGIRNGLSRTAQQ